MSRRRVRSRVSSRVVVGWTEVWSTTADGFEHEGSVPLERPRVRLEVTQDGRYRLRARAPIEMHEVQP